MSHEKRSNKIEDLELQIEDLQSQIKTLQARRSRIRDLEGQLSYRDFVLKNKNMIIISLRNSINNLVKERDHWKNQVSLLCKKGSSK